MGRWLSLDAVNKPYQGNYNFASNSPIMFIDKGGDDDYYYDSVTRSIHIVRNGAPHRFFFTDYIYSEPGDNGIQTASPVVKQMTNRQVKELFYYHNNVFRDALKHSPREDYGRIYNTYENLGNEAAAEGLAILGAPLALIVGMEALATYGMQGIATFLLNEAKDEALSVATDGASDVLDLTKMAYKGAKKAGEFVLKKESADFVPKRLPKSNGDWVGERGNGLWYSNNEKVKAITQGQGVPFSGGYPDFSKWSKGEVQFNNLDGTDNDFKKVYEFVMKEKGLKSRNAAKKYLKEKGLTPHHHQDGKTIQFIPTDLHGNVPHAGGASNLRNGRTGG